MSTLGNFLLVLLGGGQASGGEGWGFLKFCPLSIAARFIPGHFVICNKEEMWAHYVCIHTENFLQVLQG